MSERDELRGRLFMELLRYGRNTGHGTDETFECADRILALLPQQPKLEWREGRSTLFINGIETAATVVERPGMSYWIASLTPLGVPLFIGSEEASARTAVERAVKEALGWNC